MPMPPLHQSTGLYLTWIGGLCATVVLLLGDVLPFPVTFATPANFFLCLVQVEVFFALLIWPFFVPALGRQGAKSVQLPAYLVVLLIFALPLVLIAANVSSVQAAGVVRSQALVAGLALLAAGFAANFRNAVPGYIAGVFAFSALPPFELFLQSQMGAKGAAATLWLSPFWAAAADGAPGWILAGLTGVAGMVLLTRRPVA
jgi:hypothetical protein